MKVQKGKKIKLPGSAKIYKAGDELPATFKDVESKKEFVSDKKEIKK